MIPIPLVLQSLYLVGILVLISPCVGVVGIDLGLFWSYRVVIHHQRDGNHEWNEYHPANECPVCKHFTQQMLEN